MSKGSWEVSCIFSFCVYERHGHPLCPTLNSFKRSIMEEIRMSRGIIRGLAISLCLIHGASFVQVDNGILCGHSHYKMNSIGHY